MTNTRSMNVIVTRFVALAFVVLLTGNLNQTEAAGAADTPPWPPEDRTEDLDLGKQISQDIWCDINEALITLHEERLIIPDKYRTVAAELTALDMLLASAPIENAEAATNAAVVLPLPLPDGTFGHFRIKESPIIEPTLAAKFPKIKTYLGQGVDDPAATARFDRTPAGFHAMILSNSGTVYIDPYSQGDKTNYVVYYGQDYPIEDWGPLEPDSIDVNPKTAPNAPDLSQVKLAPSGDQLRRYRLAAAATGEFTAVHGGTVDSGMAAIITIVNRVNLVYERDVAVRMVLVSNNDRIVYTNAATDPYTTYSQQSDNSTLLRENQDNLDKEIGDSNYDVGHLFACGGGNGLARLHAVCSTGTKARAVSNYSLNPVVDMFITTHEMGHQFGGYHTFNATTTSSCSSQRIASAAYEPGSGSTIMSYFFCGAESLRPISHDYFHTHSIDQIVAYTTVGHGNTCASVTPTGNTAPTVNAGLDVVIPRGTPFTLTGSATDPDGDALTYAWEQYDLGKPSPPNDNSDGQSRPIFRSFPPVTSPSRTFPQLSDILNSTVTLGEALPTITQTLTLRLTVRDNRAGGGGVNYHAVSIHVVDTAGPFVVIAPNTPVSWIGGTREAARWDVANTDMPPVSCATVDILLSTDGGNTFPFVLAAGTANDRIEMVTVPNNATTAARVKVQCTNNVFFDISNSDFTILPEFNVIPVTTRMTYVSPGDGLCSLIEAINEAQAPGSSSDCKPGSPGPDIIELAVTGPYILQDVDNNTDGANGLPSITSEITITGNGATIERDPAAPDFRILHVAPAGDLTLNRLAVRLGVASRGFPGDVGGCISNWGTVKLVSSTVEHCRSIKGGGIGNNGTLKLYSSTVAHNHADDLGGGIGNAVDGVVGIINSTVSFNNVRATGDGGGIYNAGKMALTSSTVGGGNSAQNGGGIFNRGELVLTNSTASHNLAFDRGGGILNQSGTVALTHCTISNNVAQDNGGGVVNRDGKVEMAGTIISRQISGGGCSGAIDSRGYNLVSDVTGCDFIAGTGDKLGSSSAPLDPLLSELQDNGGPTETHALMSKEIAGVLVHSPAIDVAPSGLCPDQDQRGAPRPIDLFLVGDEGGDMLCDIGAFERQPTETAIDLLSFAAHPATDRVLLSWETGTEVDNAGFNLWRAMAADGPYTKLNDAPIPAEGDDITGASYAYTDTDVVKGATYYYKLEDVDIHGVGTFHGPVSATPGRVHLVYLPLVLR